MSIFIYMDYQIKFKNKETCQNVFLSSYFVTNKKLLPSDNFDVIKNIYTSFKQIYDSPKHKSNYNTQLRIFHDNLSSEFIKKYSTKKIKFIKVATKDIHYSKEDLLLFCVQQFIQYNLNVKNIFIIGHADVNIRSDTFKPLEFKPPTKEADGDMSNVESESEQAEIENKEENSCTPLFISQEPTLLDEDSIFYEKLNSLNINIKDSISDAILKTRPLLSCKVIGGKRETLYQYLDLVLPFVKHINDKYKDYTKNRKSFSTTSNKIAMNYYSLFENNIVTGFPFFIKKSEYDKLNGIEKQEIMFTLDTI